MENVTLAIPAELAGDIKKQIEAYEAEQKPKPWPQKGDRYWWISSAGEVDSLIWYDDLSDHHRRDYGNIYRTKEEAKAVVDRRKAQACIDNYIRDNGIENRFVYARSNYCPVYRHVGWKVSVSCWSEIEYQSPFCVQTREIAQQIIDAVGYETVEMAIRGRVG